MKRYMIYCVLFCVVLALFAGACTKSTDPDNRVAKPVFEPAPGTYGADQTISINCATSDATIRYTTDGSEPDESSTLYSGPMNLGGAYNLKAKGFKDGKSPSKTTNGEYIVADYADNFVYVWGGTFHNGVAEVTVSGFLIDKYETTQSSYAAVMGNNPGYGYGVGDNYPVYWVDWFDAILYCNRRSIQEGLDPCYSYDSYGSDPQDWPENWKVIEENNQKVSCDWNANGYRLPTEAEWEFAARGGNLSQGYTYSGGNDPLLVGWISANSNNSIHPVGQKLPNELGIYDMCGNLMELCWDNYQEYPNYPRTDPRGPSTGMWRMARDGSWRFAAHYSTISSRAQALALAKSNYLGIRVCRKI